MKKVSAVDPSATGANGQVSSDATTFDASAGTPSASSAPSLDANQATGDPVIADPDIAEPIFATSPGGEIRPMSGGSFIRQADGTLVRQES